MRSFLTSVLATFSLVTLLPAVAAAQESGNVDVRASGSGAQIDFTGVSLFGGPVDDRRNGTTVVSRDAPPAELVGRVLAAGTLADGSPCFGVGSQVFGTAAEAQQATGIATGFGAIPLGVAGCQARGAGAVVEPEEVALEFWKQADLPVPRPEIAPGWAITGKTAYLETNAAPTAAFSWDIPGFGILTVDAGSALTVDWGDGSGARSYDSALSGPWPEGGITNVYGDIGVVDVVVTQEWTARWSLGGATGTLGGLATSGVLDDFEVRQIQAVIG